MDKDIPSYVGDLIPSISNYNHAINNYKRGIKAGDFYEEPIGEDFLYPDWQMANQVLKVGKLTKINCTCYGLTPCRKHICWWDYLLYQIKQ